MGAYLHQLAGWPSFFWNDADIRDLLSRVRNLEGRLMGRMQSLGFQLQSLANLKTLTTDVLKTSEIEGEILQDNEVRSSLARRLGLDIAGLVPSDRNTDGIVDVMLDATRGYKAPLSKERLFSWHAAIFPTGRSGMQKIVVGAWRDNSDDDPMQVVSGPLNRPTVHYEAPAASRLESEMDKLIAWVNTETEMDPVLRSAIVHLWFITIHPFDDGNGRIGRALADMQLARAAQSADRFYSMSAQIRKERKEYYAVLESVQKDTLDITGWLLWFLACLERAILSADEILSAVLSKAKFWDKHAQTFINERQRAMLNKLLDGFEGKLNTSKWAKITKVSTDTALRDITDLLEKNILAREESLGRSTSYILNASSG